MHLPSQTKFQYTGVFEGFIRNSQGKRRLLLALVDDTKVEFKLEKKLRHEWEDQLAPGALVTVTGYEQHRLLREVKRVIMRVKVLIPGRRESSACQTCVIKVCAKKNCWRSGGKELMAEVKARVAAAGLQEVVEVKAVGCLDECKRAPNMQVGKHVHTRCSAATVDKVIASIAARQSGEPFR
jgi:hypothetical protein